MARYLFFDFVDAHPSTAQPPITQQRLSLRSLTGGRIILICLCLSHVFSTPLHAAESPVVESPDVEFLVVEPPSTTTEKSTGEPIIPLLKSLDKPRDDISGRVTQFANWIDNFFGTDLIFDESQKSHLKLNLQQINEEGREPRYEINLLGKLSLPHTEERLELLFESDPKEETETGADSSVSGAVESQEQSLGVRYIQYTSDWFRAHTDAGVRFRSGFDTFVRFRLRGLFSAGKWRFRAAETIFWRDSTGFGETSRLDIERPIIKHFMFRSVSQATWLKDTDEVDVSQDFFLIHDINRYRVVVYQLGVNAIDLPDVHTTDYVAAIRLRQQLHRKWLFFEIKPEVRFPEEEEFHSHHYLTFKLEALFGGI